MNFHLDLKLLLVWGLTLFFTGDSILRALRSNFNLGSFLMYCLTAALWGYAVFHRAIDAFFSTKWGGIVQLLLCAGCVFMALLMLFLALTGYADTADGDEKAVIVLGAGLRGTRVSGLLARRLNAAYLYYEKNPNIVIVVTGGQGPQEDIPEAQAMKGYLIQKGVPESQILTEEKSTSTEENFSFARAVLHRHGIEADMPVAFVTNVFHCYRAARYAENAGFTDVDAIPASIGATSVLPCYMREVLAVLYYWVFKR